MLNALTISLWELRGVFGDRDFEVRVLGLGAQGTIATTIPFFKEAGVDHQLHY